MKKILAAVALSTAFVAAPASAQWYAGAGLGSVKTDSRQNSVKAIGGYQLDGNVGVEVAFTDLGRYRGSTAKAVSLALVGALPLDGPWALIGKIGASSNRTGFAGSSDRKTVLLGIGIGYTVSRHLGVRLEYEQYGRLIDSGGYNDRADNLVLVGKVSF